MLTQNFIEKNVLTSSITFNYLKSTEKKTVKLTYKRHLENLLFAEIRLCVLPMWKIGTVRSNVPNWTALWDEKRVGIPIF
jgi:hypothetical protein